MSVAAERAVYRRWAAAAARRRAARAHRQAEQVSAASWPGAIVRVTDPEFYARIRRAVLSEAFQ